MQEFFRLEDWRAAPQHVSALKVGPGYFDLGIGEKSRWRSEPTKNKAIGKNRVHQMVRRLVNVKAEYTPIRINFRKPKSSLTNHSARVPKRKNSAKKMCKDGIRSLFNLRRDLRRIALRVHLPCRTPHRPIQKGSGARTLFRARGSARAP